MGNAQLKRRTPDRTSEPGADPVPVTREIERLGSLDLAQLRVQFRNRTGRIAPARLSRPLLLRVLAYRLQAELFGDLRPDTRRMLDRLASSGGSGANAAAGAVPTPGPERPRTGTVLLREWQGRMERVRVGDDGFDWNGHTHASLSAVALAITGTKWNGRRFFGLTQRPATRPGSGAAP